ncbi:glycosyltransferase family 2 protein [Duganella aceris]|uniref:Glycosyltransferase family 2 protein n=1 Tax=Duganella aceris TaxID=2703883 RepID=A0ABX0FTM8_9BURK|nr:glycosyltransferase family 2 protein [Duganella aceris]NGZ88045.1 glycosyltransferase family 2 protein [Duganella aceris]
MTLSLKSLSTSLHVRTTDVFLKAKLRHNWAKAAPRLRSAKLQGDNDFDVVISLTSYPPRFGTLHLTLQSLLLQAHTKKKVALWIAHKDIDKLPTLVTALVDYGLEIHACEDTRSYKKLIPALKRYPTHPIVIADDDAYYWPQWLDELLATARGSDGNEVICHRMHRIRLGADGLPLPYTQWESESRRTDASPLHFPTGIGGVLYLPGILPAEVFDQQAYTELCPTGDDIWFYWMARSNGASFRCTQSTDYIHNWRGSQAAALAINNVGNDMNDKQIMAMIDRFGYFSAK